ncbi:hypothetical protein LMG29542_02476 [Paraburkholderia humisilvae]|uniref:Uncharacterized protein n=1 Tax=Paraburkholderia humisilvae TaxID=627669 RepID=A0A6J5DMY1_9BURK|nr:hypothetical protein LMG29542_02476 [Paraburkholderia humisilvae]
MNRRDIKRVVLGQLATYCKPRSSSTDAARRIWNAQKKRSASLQTSSLVVAMERSTARSGTTRKSAGASRAGHTGKQLFFIDPKKMEAEGHHFMLMGRG